MGQTSPNDQMARDALGTDQAPLEKDTYGLITWTGKGVGAGSGSRNNPDTQFFADDPLALGKWEGHHRRGNYLSTSGRHCGRYRTHCHRGWRVELQRLFPPGRETFAS